MAMPTLIYCAHGNKQMAESALSVGFRYGSRLPGTVYHPVYFADQNWKKPNRTAYMAALAQHRPMMATVIDWEREEQLAEVLDWAEEAAQYVAQVLIIPKVFGGIIGLPRRIGQADIILGYSVPTQHGGTDVPTWEFDGWPVHLLGGQPQHQMRLWHYLNVYSVDGNYANRMATQYCKYWVPRTGTGKTLYWEHLAGYGHDGIYRAFARSCENIMMAWRALAGSNNEFHLTAAQVDSAAPNVDVAQPQVNPDR